MMLVIKGGGAWKVDVRRSSSSRWEEHDRWKGHADAHRRKHILDATREERAHRNLLDPVSPMRPSRVGLNAARGTGFSEAAVNAMDSEYP